MTFVKVDHADNIVSYPYNVENIREEYPNISFPPYEILPIQDLTAYGVFRVAGVKPQDHDPATQTLVENNPQLTDEGWVQQWIIIDLSDDQQQIEKKSRISILSSFVQARLNNFAATRGYDDVNSAAKYKDITDQEIATLPVEEQPLVLRFRAECRYLALATASTWAAFFLIVNEKETSGQPIPSSFDEVEPLLPPLEWPE